MIAATPRFASPADTSRYGHYRVPHVMGDQRPTYRFSERLGADGSSPYPAQAGRYHLYAARACPWAHRAVLTLELAGLHDAVGVSYVDAARDARGWAFREDEGPDPVNGFRLLREAYEATDPDFDGHVSVPVLWDRLTGRVVSNDPATIDVDLATAFVGRRPGHDLHPARLASAIAELDAWLGPTVNRTVALAATSASGSRAAQRAVAWSFDRLDARLAGQRYLLGDRLSLADLRLWVSLVRYDVAVSWSGTAPRLAAYPWLWRYARDVYAEPAVAATTDFVALGGEPEHAVAWGTRPLLPQRAAG